MTHPTKNLEGHFFFEPDDPIYAEHFPGHPVVPGSLIIHAFMEAAKKQVAVFEPWTIRDFRFKRFITPGRYAFRIQARQDGRMGCTLFDDSSAVVTGTL